MNKKWTVPLLVLVLLAVEALFVPEPAAAVTGGVVDTGDTAWLLTATCLVLLMTPGPSFFYGGMVSRKNVISTMLQSFVALDGNVVLGTAGVQSIEEPHALLGRAEVDLGAAIFTTPDRGVG